MEAREVGDRFKEIVQSRHDYARSWKERTGGMVVGYYEPYFPEELVYAAGMLPVRFLADYSTDVISAKWIYASCYPVKSMVNQYLSGRYDYLDALVSTRSCNWMYNAYEVMKNNTTAHTHLFLMPDHIDSPTTKDLVVSELKVLKGKVEQWTGKEITDQALDHAIEVYNLNRKLLRRIYQLRRKYRSVILGSEAMNIVLASQVMDKAEMNKILIDFIEELEDREPNKDMIRLMLIGSETFDTSLEELVESLGANVVIDELENGSGYFWNDVIEQRDRLMALALRYTGIPHSAIKDNNWRRRPQRIFELSEDYFVDGAIIAKQIYCHPHGTDAYVTWKLLRERMIPFHYFERDMTLPTEETQARLEAFLNLIRPGLNRIVGFHKTIDL